MIAERTTLKAKRRTRTEVQKLVEEFRRSGMLRMDFCREKGLSLSTLARHLRKSNKQVHDRNKQTMATSTLIPVGIAEGKCSFRTLNSGLAVVLSGGRRIEVQADFDLPTLHRLITALEPA